MKLFIHNVGKLRLGKRFQPLKNWNELNGFTWQFFRGYILVFLIPARSAKASGGTPP